MMLIWLSLILFAVVLLLVSDGKKKKIDRFFPADAIESQDFKAINLRDLVPQKKWQQIKANTIPVLAVLGPRAKLYVVIYILLSLLGSWYIVQKVLNMHSILLTGVTSVLFIYFGYRYLADHRRKQFENTFPDALNMLMSAVTAGDSLMHAILYVGKTMDNAMGKEFKWMGERLKMGDTPDSVFKRACKTYPYPEFVFFTVTMRANISRGGQLKGVLARLIRVLIESRTMNKKKMAMTSEARISAKIVAAIPLGFAILLNSIRPDNIDYILNDPSGRSILYYVLGSEMLGLFIIWFLVRSVK